MVPGKYLMGQSAPSDQLTFQNYSNSTVRIEYNDPTYGAQSATVNRMGDGNGNGDSAILCADETYQYTSLVTITYGVGTATPQSETVEYYSRSGGGNDDVALKQQLLVKAEAKLVQAKKALVKAKKALKKAKKSKKRAAIKKAKARVRKARVAVWHARSDVNAYRIQVRDARQMTAYCTGRRVQ
ncbi:MAG TPA: hypothetical protein VGE34_02100 [Candidatus Saccharimonadales bacterium]